MSTHMGFGDSDIPFPSMVVVESSRSPTPELKMNDSVSSVASPVSQETNSSSKLTSSDKLSDLPPPTKSPSPNTSFSRPTHPSSYAMNNIKRGWRHSFDATTSLPSISAVDYNAHGIWSRPQNAANARLDTGSRHQRTSTPENGSGYATPRQRVSFDRDRNIIGQAFSRMTRDSNSPAHSPPPRVSPFQDHPDRDGSTTHDHGHLNSRSPSHPRSRATSPLRMLQQWSSGFHRGHHAVSEEPFIAVDPFKLKSRSPFCGLHSHNHDIETGGSATSCGAYDCDDLLPVNTIRSFFRDARIFLTDILLRQLYLNFLLRLPAVYFSRVARIFEDADVSRPDIQRMINASGGGARFGGPLDMPPSPDPNVLVQGLPAHGATLSPDAASGIGLTTQVGAAPAGAMMHLPLPFPDEWTPTLVSPALIRFKHSWEAFIDSLLREWKTLNVVSALLASAILTIFQIPEAAGDPVTRTLALMSLMCALMSLTYGCMFIVRFGTMRSMFYASRWAEEAQKTKTSIWWNVWVLLATPAVWMAWAMLLFLSSILLFVWRTGSAVDPEDRPPLGARVVLGPRIVITSIFVLGLVYLAMIIKTLKKYGSQQNSTRAILEAGSSLGVVVGKAGNEGGGKQIRADDNLIEAAMERRGRERQRSTSARVRRRENENDGARSQKETKSRP